MIGRGQPAKRIAARVTLLLIAGFTASVAVAWAIEFSRAIWSSKHFLDPPPGSPVYLPDPENRAVKLRCTVIQEFGRTEWIIDRLHAPWTERDARATPPPGWVLLPNPGYEHGTTSSGYGFPVLCLKHDEIDDWSHTTTVAYRNALRWTIKDRLFVAEFPLRPLFPGLLLNTLFYTSLFTLPFTLKRLRRRLRSRRGHCPHCNYNLLHDYQQPCPECGTSS